MMLRANGMIRLKHSIFCALLPMRLDYDKPSDVETSPEERKETGSDRLRKMFTRNEYGTVSPEMSMTLQASMTGIMFGAIYGGFIRSRRAYLEFIEQNQATSFKHHYEAKKLLQDHVTVSFAKGAFAWGWRLGLFTGSFIFVSSCVSLYRGKSGILEYAAAGGVSGCLYRTKLGLKGMIVGTLLGTVLGTFCGCIVFALLKATGISMEEIRAYQYRYTEYRAEKTMLRAKKLQEEKSDDVNLIKQHDEKTKEGASLEILNSVSESSIGK